MRGCLVIAVLLIHALPSWANLDPEPTTPYHPRVILAVEPHSHFTPYFVASLQREIQSSLAANLGRMVEDVRVLVLNDVPEEERDPPLKTFAEDGFDGLTSLSELGPPKTHFIRLSFDAGQYVIEGRQYDGSTGFVSPLVRRSETAERALIGRLAALMIDRDFGLVGTIRPPERGNNRVRIDFKASGLTPDLSRWVRPGDVFALVQIRDLSPPRRLRGDDAPEPPRHVGFTIPGAILRVIDEPRDGGVSAQVFFRYAGDPMPSQRRILGYRCVKLGTTRAPVRVRLKLTDGARVEPRELRVRAHDRDFTDPRQGDPFDEMIYRDGVFVSNRPYSNVAFARVLLNSQVAQLPIPILEADRVVEVEVSLDPMARARAPLEQARAALLARIGDARLVQNRLFRDLNELQKTGKNDQALKRAESALASLEADAVELTTEAERFSQQVADVLPGSPNFTGPVGQFLAGLGRDIDVLRGHIKQLREVVRKEQDPGINIRDKELTGKQARAELLVGNFQIDEALKLFDEILAEQEEPKIRARREEIAKAWQPRDDAHRKARSFVYDTWSGLTERGFADVKANLAEAERAGEKLIQVQDRFALGKMDQINQAILQALQARRDQLKNSAEEEDKETLKDALDVLDRFSKLGEKVNAFVAS